jgi:UDP-N-acetylglucosamine 4,6-dehydratase
VIGIRPGEKLHELMITKEDARRTIDLGHFYIIQPDFLFWRRRFNYVGSKPVAEDFEYSSGTNPHFLSVEDMKEMINHMESKDENGAT